MRLVRAAPVRIPTRIAEYLLRSRVHFSDILTSLSGRPSICSVTSCGLTSHGYPLAGTPSCAWRLTVRSLVDARVPTSGYVKLLLPPRQSRANSHFGLENSREEHFRLEQELLTLADTSRRRGSSVAAQRARATAGRAGAADRRADGLCRERLGSLEATRKAASSVGNLKNNRADIKSGKRVGSCFRICDPFF